MGINTVCSCYCSTTTADHEKWDTANVYSNGSSEDIVGKALKKYNIPRNKVVILTKCFSPVGETKDIRSTILFQNVHKSKDYINQSGRAQILVAVKAANGFLLQVSRVRLF